MRAFYGWCKKHWDWIVVVLLSLAASWQYFFGTSFVLGLDYFTHLFQGHIVKLGIEECTFIPAYHYMDGAGTTFIRYQGLLVAQLMGWLCYILQKVFALSDTQTIMYAGRIVCIAINLLVGLAFHYSIKKLISIPTVAMVATSAYIFGWARLGVLLHMGALERAGTHIFYPICFSLFLTLLSRSLTRREQVIWGLSLSGCLMTHPGNFIFITILMILYGFVEFVWLTSEFLYKRNYAGIFKHIYDKCRDLILPFILTLGLCAWYILPCYLEMNYFGWYKYHSSKNKPGQTSWNEVLPAKYIKEFVDRDIWFKNMQADPKTGGSYLASESGVNSAYLGISVLFLAFLAFFLTLTDKAMGKLALKIWISTIFIFIIIFWEGMRYNIFKSFGLHLILPCRWLAIFYFLVCVLALFGSLFIFKLLKHISHKNILVPHLIMILFLGLIVWDFTTLIYQDRLVYEVYLPKKINKDPLGLLDNYAAFDSYDIILNYPRKGRVMDFPPLLFNCNSVYHRQQIPYPVELATSLEESLSYDDMVRKDIKESLTSSFPGYDIDDPNYSLRKEWFSFDPQIFFSENGLSFHTRSGWQGKTTFELKFSPVSGIKSGVLAFPIYLCPNLNLNIKKNGKPIRTEITQGKGQSCTAIILFNTIKDGVPINIQFEFAKNSIDDEVKIGYPDKPYLIYNTPSFAYRLALLNIRFIVVNLSYMDMIYPDSKPVMFPSGIINRIYQSESSVLYENILSSPFFFPHRVYLIDDLRAFEFFNKKISRHPNYNPCIAGFCYQGNPKIFDGVIQPSYMKNEDISQIFGQTQKKQKCSAKIQKEYLESITFEINMDEEGFFLPSLRFHPNLRAFIAPNTPVEIYMAQAGMIAMRLPKGTYELKIYYHHPWYDILGKCISLFTAVTCLIFVLFFKLRDTWQRY